VGPVSGPADAPEARSAVMNLKYPILAALLVACASAQEQPILLKVSTLLDGKGGVQHNTTIALEGGKILRIDPSTRGVTFDLTGLTVMPGLIDTHVHIGSHFGPDGKLATREDSQASAMGYAMENVYSDLMAGITTVQSVGSPIDRDVRDAINRGVLPGPRVLTSLRQITDTRLTPEQIRDTIRQLKTDGADLIKIFASKNFRDGGAQTLSDQQIMAACGEAKAQGLRTLVHVYSSHAIMTVSQAGCTSVEHGTLISDEALQFLAAHGTYFDPNIGVVAQNYVLNKAKFIGVSGFTEESLKGTETRLIPASLEMFKRALATKGLKIVFGTDAVAGAHGRNVEELIYRVEKGGQTPQAAIVSGTSLSAESMSMGDKIGSLAPGMEADIIAVAGDPLADITALRRVVFVMRAGKVYKAPSAADGRQAKK
jgi:imidazolonepropionase-like amidohydrolase